MVLFAPLGVVHLAKCYIYIHLQMTLPNLRVVKIYDRVKLYYVQLFVQATKYMSQMKRAVHTNLVSTSSHAVSSVIAGGRY